MVVQQLLIPALRVAQPWWRRELPGVLTVLTLTNFLAPQPRLMACTSESMEERRWRFHSLEASQHLGCNKPFAPLVDLAQRLSVDDRLVSLRQVFNRCGCILHGRLNLFQCRLREHSSLLCDRTPHVAH